MTDERTDPAADPALVDTHCHLFLMERDPAEVVAEAVGDGVAQMVCAGIDPETSRASLALAEAHPQVFATAGMHPHTASDLDDRAKGQIEALVGHPRVVAIGETGLDHFRMLSPKEDQRAAFAWHVALSNEVGKPLVVHIRDAWDEVLEVLDAGNAERVVIHCFSGDAERARACGERGYTMSFAANITYRRNGHLREAAAAAPERALVVETDSPFLPPERLRGRENVPANAREALLAVAEQRGVAPGAMAATMAWNARRAFGLPRPGTG